LAASPSASKSARSVSFIPTSSTATSGRAASAGPSWRPRTQAMRAPVNDTLA
jgi:hypothetical protein